MTFILLLLCSCVLHACITDKYDFDKSLNMGLSFSEQGLMLPGISDIDVPMSQVVELSDSSELMVDPKTGNYLFYKKKDDMDTVTVCMQRGSLCDGTMDELEYRMVNNPQVELTPSKRNPDFASLTFETVISPSFEPDVLKEAIRELYYMKVNLDIEVTMNFSKISGFAYFNELKYEVPFFFVVEDESQLTEKNVRADGLHTHTIHVVGVDLTRTSPYEGEVIGIHPVTHRLNMKGSVHVKGSVKSVNIADFESSDSQIDYRVMVGTLGTLAVTGRFDQREEVDIEPMVFEDLPDFIKDEEAILDIDNPHISLSLWNELPADISLNAVLTGWREGSQISALSIGSDYGTQGLIFHGPAFGSGEARQTNMWVSRLPISNLPDSVTDNVVIPEVMDLVRRMPDEVNVEAYVRTDSTKVLTLSLSEEYRAVPRYELTVPLKMGKDMKIVYTKEFDGLNSGMKQIELNEINFTAIAENRLPLNLSMKMQAFDTEGNEVEGLTYVMPDENDQIPGYVPESLSLIGLKNISVIVKNAGSENCLKRVDKLRFKVYALSSAALEGQYLNRNQNLQLRNIKVLLK